MSILLIIVHVIVCIVLILVVLLQAGRGGGVSDMMGGGQPQSIFGTQTNAFMTRATEVCAVLFIVTSLSLGIVSSQRGKSLVEKHRMVIPPVTASAVPETPKAPVASVASVAPTTPAATVPATTALPVEGNAS